MRPRALATPLVAAALALAGCGSDGDDGTSAPSISITDPLETTIAPLDLTGDLPPVDAIHAASIFGEDLDRLGLRMTNRGGLIDRTDGQYVKSTDGTHYALYVEPVSDDYSDADYARNLVELTRVTAPVLFERYPALESYDICQEPRSADDDSDYPPPTTQIEMTRAEVDAIDWDGFDHDALAAAQDGGALVRISEALAGHPDLARYTQP